MSAPQVFNINGVQIFDDDAPLLTLVELLGESSRLVEGERPSLDLKEYYGSNSHIASQIKMYSLTRGAAEWMSTIARVEYTQNIKFFTTYLEFNQSLAEDAPPGAPNRLVTFKESFKKFGLGRKGLGVQAPTGFHMDKRGQMMWRMQILQVASGIEDAQLLQAIEALLDEKPYLETILQTTGINYTEEQYLADQAKTFAFFQKAKGGFQNLIPEAKRRIAKQDGDFDALIINESTYNYLGLVPEKSAENMEHSKESGNEAALLLKKNAMKIGIVDTFIMPPLYVDNNVQVDLLARRDKVGGHTVMYDKRFGNTGYLYDSRHLSYKHYDQRKNSFEIITLDMAIANSGIGSDAWKKYENNTDPATRMGVEILKLRSFATLLAQYEVMDRNAGADYALTYKRYLGNQIIMQYLGSGYRKKLSLLRSAFKNGLTPYTSASPTDKRAGYMEFDSILNELSELFDEMQAVKDNTTYNGLSIGTFYDLVLSFVPQSALDPILRGITKQANVATTAASLKLPNYYAQLVHDYKPTSIHDTKGADFSNFVQDWLEAVPNSKRILHKFVDNHWPIPYAWIAAKVDMEYTTNATICVKKDSKTMSRYKGDQIFTIGQDATQQGIIAHATIYCGVNVHTPKNLLRLESTHVQEYHRGCGSVPYMFDEAVKNIRNYYNPTQDIYGYDNECSIHFLAIPPWEAETLPNPLSVTGNFMDQLKGLQLIRTRIGQHFATAAAYHLIWQWPEASGGVIPAVRRIEKAPLNWVTWQQRQDRFMPDNEGRNGDYSDIQPETGPFEGLTFPDCAKYRTGSMVHVSEIQKTNQIE
jgi:hypothetical protein